MMIVPAKHLTLIAAHNNPMGVESEVFQVGTFNYTDVTLKVHSLFAVGPPPTVHAFFDIWGSIDGQRWSLISGITADRGTAGLSEAAGSVTAPFIRFHFSLSLSGSVAGNWATAILCCHANLSVR